MADRGLQAERTLLSWQRLCLAFAVVSALYMRLGYHTMERAGLVVGSCCIMLAVVAYVAIWRRHEAAVKGMAEGTESWNGAHLFLAWLAIAVFGGGVVALVAVSELR